MTIRARFFTALTDATRFEAIPKTADLSFVISATPEFSVAVLRSQVNTDLINEGGIAVEISIDGVVVIGGMCQRVPEGDDSPEVTITGRQWLDLVYDERAYSQAVYKNVPVLVVIGELLRRIGWRIGDISTVVDKAAVTTIDLRSEDQLLPQVTKLVGDTPDLFYRYGGKFLGKHYMDIGLFGVDSYTTFVTPSEEAYPSKNVGLIESLKREISQTDRFRDLELIGGEVEISAAVTRSVNLGDALTAQPSLSTDPNFPIIVEIASFVWKIRNNAVPATITGTRLQKLTQYAPEKTGTTILAADIQNAGLAMYKAGVKILKAAGQSVETLTIEADGPISMMPRLGDLVYVRGVYSTSTFDPLLEVASPVYRKVEGYYRVNNIKISYKGDSIGWTFGLSSGTVVPQTDEVVDIYTQTKTSNPPAGAVYVPPFAPVMATIAQTVSGGISDATMSDGTPAKVFSTTLPVAPGGATGVYLAGLAYGTSTFGTVKVELISEPVFGGAGASFKVAVSNNWLPGYSASMETRIIWI